MHFLSLLGFLICSVNAAPSLHVIENILSKRQSAPIPATGVQIGQILPRREIRDLQQNYPDEFNVYLLGLQRLQSVDQQDSLSWFQVAGIHGVPKIPWDGVAGEPLPNNNSPGYCTHVSNIFLPWHRPYLALFEQVLVSHAQDAANEFPPGPDRDRYLTAAATLRMPYWDWAASLPSGQNVIPDVMVEPTIQVTSANGTSTVANPLYSYVFHPIDPGLAYQPVSEEPFSVCEIFFVSFSVE
jgi:tyrosinase